MGPISLNPDVFPVGWAISTCLLAVVLACFLLRSTMLSKHSSSPQEPASDRLCGPSPQQGVHLEQVKLDEDETNTEIDIVAIHGLGTTSRDTWAWKDPTDPTNEGKWVNWLHHADMLPKDLDRVRIFTCDWPADLLQPSTSVQRKLEEDALLLLDGLQRDLLRDGKRRKDKPIMFIASCLGGIILMKALVHADDQGSSYYCLRKATRGIIFLATPFRGTAFQDVATWAEPGLETWASFQGQKVHKALDLLKGSTFEHEELVRKFTLLCQDEDNPCHVFNFYELGKTSLTRKPFPWLPSRFHQSKQLVDRSSATLDIVPNPLPLNRPHSRMNKFHGPECSDYKIVAGKIKELVEEIRVGTLLAQADAWILEEHYTQEKLQIVRLSGELLSMDQCYINLAIVEQFGRDSRRSNEGDVKSSPFSILSRQKVETRDKTMQVDLATLFNQRKGRDGRQITPRRVLIRGPAGVGKTTLCKKIVYDFTRHTKTDLNRSWTELFDRILWVPLRNLIGRQPAGYNYEKLFYHEYFSREGDKNGYRLAEALWRDIKNTDSSRTLFILDGLDEISQVLGHEDDMMRFVTDLLKQRNVIITSRPSASFQALRGIDLELETIGFYPDQVKAYLEADPKMKAKANEVQVFLQSHWLLQGLVRIPIQLDALCYTWQDLEPGTVPDTMTSIYKGIVQRLWEKDISRLGKKHGNYSDLAPVEIERGVNKEIALLECLAFNGLCNGLVDFTPAHRHEIAARFHLDLPLNETLGRLSFLRTSDQFSKPECQNYHFLHLTFQEYFAARYFVRQWEDKSQLEYVRFKKEKNVQSESEPPTDPRAFLGKHKYTARYDILWRFVAGLLNSPELLFEIIEQEPIDLLGPAHQRLVMHCLSELPEDSAIRPGLEQRLSRWILFECELTPKTQLAREIEVPERALHMALSEASNTAKIRILLSLQERAMILPSIVERVCYLLSDEDRSICTTAAVVLGQLRDLPEGAIMALTVSLDDEDEGVRGAAARALGWQIDLPEVSLKALAERLEDENGDVRNAAAEALGKTTELLEGILGALVARLDNENKDVRRVAAEDLHRHRDLPEGILRALAARLGDEDENVRFASAAALSWQMALPEDIVMALAVRLDDEDGNIRYAAAEALGEQADLPEGIIMALAVRLDDKDERVRYAAAAALGWQMALPEDILRALAARLEDEDENVRFASAAALGWQMALPEDILRALAARLDDEHEDVRYAVVSALSTHTDLSEGILRALAARLDDEDRDVRSIAAEALGGRTGLPEDILRALAARLDDEDRNVRSTAAEALGGRTGLPEDILGALVARLDDEDGYVRRGAAEALYGGTNLSDFYSTLLGGSRATSLYRVSLERSFEEHSSWYIDDDHLAICKLDDVWRVSIGNRRNKINAMIKEVRRSIGFPMVGGGGSVPASSADSLGE